jgi:hypothetical protein
VRLQRQAPAGAVAGGRCFVHSDAHGTVRAADLVPGAYAWTVQARGCAPASGMLEVLAGGVATQLVELERAR